MWLIAGWSYYTQRSCFQCQSCYIELCLDRILKQKNEVTTVMFTDYYDTLATIWYHREYYIHKQSDSFFRINFQFAEDCQCNSTEIKASEFWKSFTSPGYSYEYCNKMDCSYHFIYDNLNYFIEIRFLELDLKESDYINFYYSNPYSQHIVKK
ncbi:unnamed protein product [Bursaphelenchus okinawaensis]|uniref:CUB domain-containing protein n=1 Tax=Bursaphelenchus okinawaensis TaxID=465554 RepID=A0A811LMB9_9BILA|nr:unnamed protein product [Bursaphelenchus okinawaensis]CAG9125143.1 unnamed protein product [Bursaphelenchus okinawaensis]